MFFYSEGKPTTVAYWGKVFSLFLRHYFALNEQKKLNVMLGLRELTEKK